MDLLRVILAAAFLVAPSVFLASAASPKYTFPTESGQFPSKCPLEIRHLLVRRLGRRILVVLAGTSHIAHLCLGLSDGHISLGPHVGELARVLTGSLIDNLGGSCLGRGQISGPQFGDDDCQTRRPTCNSLSIFSKVCCASTMFPASAST